MKKVATLIFPLFCIISRTSFATVTSAAVETPLNFGTIMSLNTPQSITISPQNGAVSGATSINSERTRGTFSVNGPANKSYNVVVPTSVNISNGGNSMTANLTSYPATTGQLNNSGQDTLYIGGTLNIGSSQPAGDYTGTYTINIQY